MINREAKAPTILDNVNALVDSIFDEDTVRESFRVDENISAPLELASGDSSIVENNSQSNGHQAKEQQDLEPNKGIFDDAEDDAELPSAFSTASTCTKQ